jgi:serine/threonine-protein kinase
MPALKLGKYTIVAELARGGMGIVYLGVARGRSRTLRAIKRLRPEFSRDETYVAMFLQEARLAARLSHPNIVQTIDVGTDARCPFLAMEYLDGRPLHAITRRMLAGGRHLVGAHLRIVVEVLRGIHHAHSLRDSRGRALGIVHRDVSPPNVFVTFDGRTKVIDFGVAKARDSSLETTAGILKGRVAYMAPERVLGCAVDHRSDIYSVGVMLWEAAARRRLWQGLADIDVLRRLLRGRTPSLRSVCAGASEELLAICERAMAPDPVDRHGSAAELLQEVEAHLEVRRDNVTMRDVGEMLCHLFADERRTDRVLLEGALQARARGWSGPIARLNVESDPLGLSLTVPSIAGPFVDIEPEASWSRSHPPRAIPLAPGWPAARATMPSDSSQSSWMVSAMNPLSARRNTVLARTTGAAMAAALVVGLVLGRSRGGWSAPLPTAPQARAHSAPVDRPSIEDSPVNEVVAVEVDAQPASALIEVDGTAVLGNPYVGRYARDDRAHRIRALASGFEPQWRDVVFRRDVVIEMHLERSAGVSAAAPTHAFSAPAHGAPSSLSSVAPRGEPANAEPAPGVRRPLVLIQTSNPYGEP